MRTPVGGGHAGMMYDCTLKHTLGLNGITARRRKKIDALDGRMLSVPFYLFIIESVF